MSLFSQFLEINNLHHNLYFSTLKVTLSFVIALQLFIHIRGLPFIFRDFATLMLQSTN